MHFSLRSERARSVAIAVGFVGSLVLFANQTSSPFTFLLATSIGLAFGAFAPDVKGLIVFWLLVGFCSSDLNFLLGTDLAQVVHVHRHGTRLPLPRETLTFQVSVLLLCSASAYLGSFGRQRILARSERLHTAPPR